MSNAKLDAKTLESLADLICGDNGPLYRKGYELPKFFQAAGLNCLNHDGSTRKWWTLERLKEYNAQPTEIQKIIARLSDTKEYPGNSDALKQTMKRLNQIVAPEGLKVELNGVTPKIVKIQPNIPQGEEKRVYAVSTPPFDAIIDDPALNVILKKRWKEVVACTESGAYLASIVMMGSILEGLFLAMVTKHPAEANQACSAPKNKEGKVKTFGEWKLAEFINVAHDLEWIQRDAKDFSQVLRDFRNLIHPWEQKMRGDDPDEDTAKICVQVVQAAINDLEAFIKKVKIQ